MNEKPTWIVEDFLDDLETKSLIDKIKELGYPLDLINKKNHFKYEHLQHKDKCVIFHGSLQMADIIKAHLPTCSPVIFGSPGSFRCSEYFPQHRKNLFNQDGEFTTLDILGLNRFDFYRRYGHEANIFVRPDDGNKLFKGGLVDLQNFDNFFGNSICSAASPQSSVYVSKPKPINGEWRFIVSRDRGIITYSTYQYQGLRTIVPGAPPAAIDKCKDVLAVGHHPASVYVIDICEATNGDCFLMEFNCFSTSGLYASNPSKLVDSVSGLAQEEFQLSRSG